MSETFHPEMYLPGGKRFIVAATIEPVQTREIFEEMPPHMNIVGWFSLAPWRRHFMNSALEQLSQQHPFQNLQGGNHAQFGYRNFDTIPVRTMIGAETGPHFALHSLVRAMGTFSVADEYADTFNPYIADTPESSIKRGEEVSMANLALLSSFSDTQFFKVEAAYPLGYDPEDIDG